MNNKLKLGALGIAVLFVFTMSTVPGAAQQRVEVPDLTVPASGHSCQLSPPGNPSCTGPSWIYDGTLPVLDDTGTLVAAGAFTVRIQELPPFNESYWTETNFTVVMVAGMPVVSIDSHQQGFLPAVGWPVEIDGKADLLSSATPYVTATSM